jgi:hypothetical protein
MLHNDHRPNDNPPRRCSLRTARRHVYLILLNGAWGVDLEVKEISLAIDTPDGIAEGHGESGSGAAEEAIDEEDFRSYREAMAQGPLRMFLGA